MALTKLSDLRHAERARARVFESSDPCKAPLKAQLDERTILFPFLFDPSGRAASSDLVALAATLRERGEEGFFLSFTLKTPSDLPQHWWVPLDGLPDLWERIDILGFADALLYGTSEEWAIAFSADSWAVAGGRLGFVDSLARHLAEAPDPIPLDVQLQEFVAHHEDDWGSHVASWFPALLEHVYGPEKASELLGREGRH